MAIQELQKISPLVIVQMGDCFWPSDYDWISDIHFDQESNLYITGNYSGDELQIGGTTLINSNSDGTTDLFLIKMYPEPVSAVSKTEKIIMSFIYRISIASVYRVWKGRRREYAVYMIYRGV